MPAKRTRNVVFVLRMLVERYIEKHKYVYVCFNNYNKAFDTVKHMLLVDLLQSLDVDQTYIRLLISLYWNQTAAMRRDDDISAWTSSQQGARQGCVASPDLFALYTGMIMKELGDMDGFRIGGTVVNNLRYADDTVIVAESEEQLQRLINVGVANSEEKGLHLNSAKSFSMVFSKLITTPTCHIVVAGNILKKSIVVHLFRKFDFLRCKM